MSKRLLLLTTVMTIAVLPVIAAAQEADSSGPKLVIPETVIDLGTVPKGDKAEARFKIVNEGSAPLQIKTVRPTCGCTVADYPKSVKAGGEGTIVVTLETIDFSGPVNKALLLMTDDPENPSTSLVVKALIQPFVDVVPRNLVRINAIQGDKAEEKVFLISDPSVSPPSFKVLKAECEMPFITTSFRELSEEEAIDESGGKQWELSISLTEDVPPGPLNTKIIVHTDHPKAKEVVVKVFGVVRALLNVTPMSVDFGAVDPTMRMGRNVVVVNNRSEGTVEITAAEIDDPAFATQVQTIEEGKRYQVAITINPDATPGSRSATLRMTTTDPKYSTLTVPISASIK